MPYVICKKPSGVHCVVPVACKGEAMLYEVALRRLFEFSDQADAECRRLEKERHKRHRALVASRQKLFDSSGPEKIDYA